MGVVAITTTDGIIPNVKAKAIYVSPLLSATISRRGIVS